MRKIGIVVAVCALLTACAYSTIIPVTQPHDAELSCPELDHEYREALRYDKEAEAVHGWTVSNVVLFIVFFPEYFARNWRANYAQEAANKRIYHLTPIMLQKKCEIPVG